MTDLLSFRRCIPGLLLCAGVAGASFASEAAEQAVLGRAWAEALVLAIVIGSVLRSFARVPEAAGPGLRCASKPLMEVAVALMGASVSLSALAGQGPRLLGGIALVVVATIALGYGLGRWLGLAPRMAMLVACGNAICGNSAIAAVAPAIGADNEDVAASVGFTAVMGIGVVLLAAPLAAALGMGAAKGGMLAGMLVYAVPQVLAAAAPMGALAVQAGTLVKLVRVLMLGPVVTVLASAQGRKVGGWQRFVPGFVLAFLALAAARTLGLIPQGIADLAHHASLLLTVVAMAGLGLGVDLRLVCSAGARVIAAVVGSLLVLGCGAWLMISLLV